MNYSLKATNLELDPSLRRYIDDKLNRDVGKLFTRIAYPAKAWIEVGRISAHHRKGNVYRAEMQLHLPGASIRGEAEDSDIRVAIDNVRDEVASQVKKYKTKHGALAKRRARAVKKFIRFTRGIRGRRGSRIREEGV